MFEASVTNPITGEIMCSYADNPRTATSYLYDAIYDQLDTDDAVTMLTQPVTTRELTISEAIKILEYRRRAYARSIADQQE